MVVTGEQAVQMMRAAVARVLFLAQRISENDYLWNPLLQVVVGDLTLPGVAVIELVRGWLELGNMFLVDELGFLGRAEIGTGGPGFYVLNHDKRFSWPDDPLAIRTFGEPQEDWYRSYIDLVSLSQSSKRIKLSDALTLGVRTFNERVRL
jgi:hypothetical protein